MIFWAPSIPLLTPCGTWKNGFAIAFIYTAKLNAVSRKSTLTTCPRIKSLNNTSPQHRDPPVHAAAILHENYTSPKATQLTNSRRSRCLGNYPRRTLRAPAPKTTEIWLKIKPRSRPLYSGHLCGTQRKTTPYPAPQILKSSFLLNHETSPQPPPRASHATTRLKPHGGGSSAARDRDKPRQGVVVSSLVVIRSGAVGFIDWLDLIWVEALD
jgi:hypothetical protein